MFELLDERVPPALVIPPAPMIATAAVVAPSTLAIESREPPGYTAPVFFPFGKPEPTAPQLKLSGVSSFKKINRSGRISISITFLAAEEESEADTVTNLLATFSRVDDDADLSPYGRCCVPYPHHPELGLVHLKRTVYTFGPFLLAASIVSPQTNKSTHTLLSPKCSLSLMPLYFSAHSRLLQGGALSDREEADAIRELEVRRERRHLSAAAHLASPKFFQQFFLRRRNICS